MTNDPSHNPLVPLVLGHVVFSQTSHGMILLVDLVQEIRSKCSRKRLLSPLCINILHHADKKALCSMSVLKLGCM